MAKAEKPKTKAKPKTKFTDKEQSERFMETAREVGADSPESGKIFEDAIRKIVAKDH